MRDKIDPAKGNSSGFPINLSKADLRAAQITQLYSQVHVGMIAAIVAAFALSALLWDSVSRELILLWMGAFLVVQIPRHLLLRRFHRKQPHGAEVLPWGTWFLAGSGITALLFGLAALVMFPSDNLVDQCLLATFLGGFAASTALAHAPLRECYVSSVLLTLLPLLGRFLYQGGESGYILAAVGLVFAGALLGTGNALHRMISSSIRLRFQRDETIRKLQDARGVLEERVAERTAELSGKNQELLDAEEALRKENEFTDTALNSQRDTFFLFEPATRRAIRWNQAFKDITGYTDEEIARMPAPDSYYSEEDLERARLCIQEVLEKGTCTIELDLLCKDGQKVPTEYDASVMKDEGGRPRYIVSIGRDIRDRKKAEESVTLEKKRFEALAHNSPFGLALIEGDGTFRYINPKFQEMFGYGLKEVPNGKTWFRKAYPESQYRHEVISAWLEDISYSGFGEQRPRIFTVTCRDDSKKIVHFRPVQLETGEHVMTCEDITERYEAEEKLRRSEEEFRRIVENLQDAFYRADMNGVFTFLSPASEQIAGYKPEEGLGRPITMFYADPAERQAFMELIMKNGFVNDFETRLVHKDGHVVWVSTSARLYKDKDGNICGVEGIARDISERKRMEMALSESEQTFRLFSEQSLLTIAILQDGVYQYVNDAASELLEYSVKEILSWQPDQFLAVVHPDDRAFVSEQARLKQAGHLDQTPHYSFRIITKSGAMKWVEIYSRTVQFRGRPANFITMLDITQRKRSEGELQKLAAVVRYSGELVNIATFDGKMVFLNVEGGRMLGIDPKKIEGHSILEVIPEHVMPLVQKELLPTLRAGRTWEGELQYRNLMTREITDVQAMCFTIRDEESGEPALLANVSVDITQRKLTDARLRESEEKYRLLFERSPVGIISVDSTGQVLEVNEALVQILGSPSPEATKAINILNFPPLIEAGVACLFRTSMANQNVMEEQISYTSKWGKILRLRVIVTPLIDDQGITQGCQAVVEDVTERWESEDLLRQSEERYRSLFDESIDGVYSTLREGEITDANAAFCKIFGYTKEDIIGRDIRELYSNPADRPKFREQIEKSGFVKDYAVKFMRKDGSELDCLLSSSVHRGKDGKVVGYRGILRDVTDQQLLQRQLIQAQKMEAIGTLAGGIAHDVNNLLQAVLGYSDLLLMKKGPGDPDTKKLKVIQQAARDGAELVSRILTFSRKGESKTRPLDLNEEILKAEKLLRRTLPRMIEIDMVLAPDIGIVDADPAQLEQVILNLGVNAHHAMPEGGRLLLETKSVSLSDEYLRAHLEAKPGGYVLLTVSDTGVGMDSKVLERIFEPFFTTKSSGLGTGLGLSMVHGIVTQHGGLIRCYSEPGRGTSFKIYFPVSQNDIAFDANLTREMPAFGTETILLVDDDERIREMGRQMIEMGGYKVLIATSGEEALDVHSSHKDEIALIILDLIMPGMGGSRCLEELLRRDPNVKVLVASGYSSNGLSRADERSGARGFVGKPYDAKDILGAIRKVLDEGYL